MRLASYILIVAAILGWGAYRLWQEPRIREVFGVSKPGRDTPLPMKNKVVVLRNAQPARPSGGKSSPSAVLRDTGHNADAVVSAADEPVTAPATEDRVARNQVDNGTVERVLLQILAAKNLSAGITVRVTDEAVRIAGTVGSEEGRRQILDIVNKGREARRIDAKDLNLR